jgi:hypothetical protein
MLSPQAYEAGRRLLGELDAAMPQPLACLYVVGSAVLDDWVAGVSDVDFVGVLASGADPDTVAALETVHAKRPDVDGIYVTVEQLRSPPARAGEAPHAREGRVWISAEHLIAVWWHSLAETGVALRGPDPEQLGIWLDRQALADWCRENLRGYWTEWVQHGPERGTDASRALASDWGVAWCVLGVLRLRYSIQTGEITSKSGAGRWGLEMLDERWRSLISEALSLRAAPAPTVAPVETPALVARREQVLEFMRVVIDDA